MTRGGIISTKSLDSPFDNLFENFITKLRRSLGLSNAAGDDVDGKDLPPLVAGSGVSVYVTGAF